MATKDRFGFDENAAPGTRFWRGPHLGRRVFFRHMAAAVGGYFVLPGGALEQVAAPRRRRGRRRTFAFS